MNLKILSNGMIDSNTYILSDKGECAVIDCGAKPQDVIRYTEDNRLAVKYILLTHGHVDHIYHARALKEATGAMVCLHEDELELYSDPCKNGCMLFGINRNDNIQKPDKLLKHGERLSLGGLELEIIHTPGHTPGGMCILCGKLLFTGDTLFSLSVGRTDLYGGNSRSLHDSIINRLYTLADDVTVYPGHGPSTSIAFERKNNPYV